MSNKESSGMDKIFDDIFYEIPFLVRPKSVSSEEIVYFINSGSDITYLGGEGPDKFEVSGGSDNFYFGEGGNDIFKLFLGGGTSRGGDDRDYFEVSNVKKGSLVNGNKGEDLIIGIGNIVYRGGQDDDLIAVSQGEVYGDKGADLFLGVSGDGYAVIQDYTIGEDTIALTGDGEWNNVESGLMYTNSSGEEVMLLVGIDDVQQVETIDGSSIGGGGGRLGSVFSDESDGDAAVGGGGGRVASNSIGDGGGWLL